MTPTDPRREVFEKALEEYRLGLIGTLTETGKVDQLNAAREMDAARSAVLRLYDEALEDARRWEDYAHHAAGCVECGETSWENCFEGKMLRDAAMATNAAPSTTDKGESNG